MVPPDDPKQPSPSVWDELTDLEQLTSRAEQFARKGAEELLGALPLPSTQRIESEAREVADEVLGRVGLPSTERICDAVQDVAESVWIPEPFRPQVPRPQQVWRDVAHGVQWVADQLAPMADALGPIEPDWSRLDGPQSGTEPRPPSKAPPSGTEPMGDDDWGLIEWFLFVLALDWLSRQELAIEIDVDHALWTFGADDDETLQQWNKQVFSPEAGFAARLGDVMMHGGPVAPGLGSANVVIGGRPALRSCDSHVCTAATPLPHAGAGFFPTCETVEINGFAALRVGDYVDEGPHGLNPIVVGCPSVTIGPRPPAVECWAPGEAKPARPQGPFGFRWRNGEIGRFKGKVVLGVDIGGPLVRVEGTVTAAKLWAEDSASFDVPLGDIDRDGKVEAWRTKVQTKTVRALGISEVQLEAHPLVRRVDEWKVTPKPNETDWPKTKVEHELVEVRS